MKTFTLLQTGEVAQAPEATVAQETAVNSEATTTTTTETPSDPASSQTQGQPQAQGGGMQMWIMLALIFGVMWFFMIRPQRKQQKELQKFRDSLQKGDKVVTIGGIFGTVVEIKENSVLIEIDNGVKMRVSKQALVKDFSEPQQ